MAIRPPFHPAILWRAALPRSQREHVNMDARYAEAIDDIVSGLRMYDMWGRLGWAEVKRRYRRTMIGPFWSSLSLAVFVAALGIVWSQLWKLNIKEYLPFLTSGLICWLLFSTFVTEGCTVFISNESLIKQLRISYMMLVCALVWRNMVVFLHNLAIYIPICIYGGRQLLVNLYTLAAIPGLAMRERNVGRPHAWSAVRAIQRYSTNRLEPAAGFDVCDTDPLVFGLRAAPAYSLIIIYYITQIEIFATH